MEISPTLWSGYWFCCIIPRYEIFLVIQLEWTRKDAKAEERSDLISSPLFIHSCSSYPYPMADLLHISPSLSVYNLACVDLPALWNMIYTLNQLSLSYLFLPNLISPPGTLVLIRKHSNRRGPNREGNGGTDFRVSLGKLCSYRMQWTIYIQFWCLVPNAGSSVCFYARVNVMEEMGVWAVNGCVARLLLMQDFFFVF